MANKIFAAAINCIDGGVQTPVINWLIRQYGADYVDMITEPGPDRLLAEAKDKVVIESIQKKLKFSLTCHNLILVAIVGHYDCVGNPAGKETQLEQILAAIKRVVAWKLGIKVIGLWVGENCEVCEVN